MQIEKEIQQCWCKASHVNIGGKTDKLPHLGDPPSSTPSTAAQSQYAHNYNRKYKNTPLQIQTMQSHSVHNYKLRF